MHLWIYLLFLTQLQFSSANNQCYSNDDCNEFATCCVDGVGDYVCSCDYGYEGDGMTCTGIISLKLTVVTSTAKDSETDSQVFVELHGESGDCGKFDLDTEIDDLENGVTGYYTFNCPDIGEVMSISIEHVGDDGWRPDYIQVENADRGSTKYCAFNTNFENTVVTRSCTDKDNQNKDKDDKKLKPDDGDEKEQKPKSIIIGIGVVGGLALLLIISIVMIKRDKKKNSLKHVENKSYGLSENEKIQHDYDKPPKGNKMTNQHVYDNPPRGNKMTNRELPQTPSDTEYLEIIPPPSDYEYYERPISKYDSIKEGEEYTSIDMEK